VSAAALPPPAALAHVRTVRVGTRNGPKLEAVRSALAAYVEGVSVVGHAVESGVPEQPVGWAEIVGGARTRARAALAGGPCELAVGIEDGLVRLAGSEVGGEGEVLNVGAAVVADARNESLGLSSGFAYPPACSARAMADREPIGALFDASWPVSEPGGGPSALPVGNVGKLSLGALTRAEYGRHAVLCALIRFLHPHLYFAEPGAPTELAAPAERVPPTGPETPTDA